MSFRPPPVSRNDVSALFNEAENCMLRYDFQGAVQNLQRASTIEKNNDKILVKLGSAYAKAYDFDQAQRCFEEGIRVSTTKAEALNAVGHHWLEVRHFEAAQSCFERIITEKQIPLVTFIRLAEVYIRLRKMDEAMALSERALRLYGGHEGALLLRAKVLRQKKNLPEAERLLRLVVGKKEYEAETRAAAWYELGAIMDQHGLYDSAYKAFMEAKALMGINAGKSLKILRMKQERLREMAQGIPANIVERWRKAGKTELQPSRNMALLCGHARSGTTMLEYVVDAHPGVVSADETSIYHNKAYFPIGSVVANNAPFTSVMDWMAPRNIRQVRADYFRGIESYLAEPIGDRLLMDKNPANTFDLPSIARIFPEIKFLVALRDPRDVCLSCFTQAVLPIPDTASWLTLEGTINHYAHIMGLWVAWKPHLAEMAHEVRYEDMVENFEPTTRRTLDFLKLPWDDRVLRFNELASEKIVRSPTFAEVTKPVYNTAIGRWRNYQRYFEPHMAKLEPFFKEFGYT